MDPFSIARYGMMAAEQRLAASAGRVAGMGSPDSALPANNVDYGAEAVDQIQTRQAFSANLGVIRVADQMWDALLGIQAHPAR